MNEDQTLKIDNARRRRFSRWSAGVALLLIPLIAMQFTDSVNWGLEDFIFASVLIFGSLAAYEFVSRAHADAAYRIGLAVGIGAAFLLLWVNGAVGVTDGEADAAYPGVVAIGVLGAVLARLRPRGMSLAMAATAIAMALVGAGALATGSVPEFNSAFEILGITAFFVVLFSGSALLFREASRSSTDREVATASTGPGHGS